HASFPTRRSSDLRYKFVNGTQDLLNSIHGESNAELRLNSTVASIHEDDHGVTVTTKDGQTLTAKQVIVTVPINALKNIEFTGPFYPTTLEISQQGQDYDGLKVCMSVRGQQ